MPDFLPHLDKAELKVVDYYNMAQKNWFKMVQTSLNCSSVITGLE
jgi:hypothetical protein